MNNAEVVITHSLGTALSLLGLSAVTSTGLDEFGSGEWREFRGSQFSATAVLKGRAGGLDGTGAVVARDVAPGSAVAGVPARLLRSREEK